MRAILDREFFGFARTRRFFVVRAVVFVLPFVLFVMLAWQLDGRPRDLVGGTVHRVTIFAVLFTALFVTPGMLAHVVPEERRRNRLDVLRSTPLTAAQLVLGKYLSRVGLVTLMVVAALTLPALALLFGGASPGMFLRGSAVVLATVMWIGAVAMFASAVRDELGAASRRAYAWTALFCIVPLVAWWFLAFAFASRGTPGATITTLLGLAASTNPFMVLGHVIAGPNPVTGSLPLDPFHAYLGFAAVVTALALRGAVGRVRSDPRPRTTRASRRPLLADGRPPSTAEAAARAAAAATARSEERDGARLLADPIGWLEERRPAVRRRRAGFVVKLALLELLVVVTWAMAGHGGPGNALVAVLAAMFAAFVAAVEGATAFKRDGEANTLDVLHSTPLSGRAIARAKIRAASRAWRPWWILASVHALIASLCAEGEGFLELLLCAPVAWVLLQAITLVALRLGLAAPSSGKALVRVFVWGAAVLVVSPLFLLLLSMGTGGGVLVAVLLGWHPFMVGSLPFWWLTGPTGSHADVVRLFTTIYFLGYVVLVLGLGRVDIPSRYAALREDGGAP